MNPNESSGSSASNTPGAASNKNENAWFVCGMVVLVFVIVALLKTHEPEANAAQTAQVDTSKPLPPVLVYGAEWCGACTLTKDWLNEQKVLFTYCDVESEAPCVDSFRAGGNVRNIPVTAIGTTEVVGFDPDEFLALLNP